MSPMHHAIYPRILQILLFSILCGQMGISVSAETLPPESDSLRSGFPTVKANQESDIPEEVLRAEIITEARSPIDGSALSATEFAELVVNTKQQVERDNASAAVRDSKYKELLFLLRLRGFLKSVGIPIK
jgi:hypothetical protein